MHKFFTYHSSATSSNLVSGTSRDACTIFSIKPERRLSFLKGWALLLLLCSTLHVEAAKRYWISSATSGWNTTANWSATSGGSGGSSVPATNDTCYFDGNGLGRCNINANVNVKRFVIDSLYTDTITQNAYTLTIGTGGMYLNGGVFTGSSSSITVTGHYHNDGCYFTSTSGTLQAGNDFRLSGSASFAHNNGTLKLVYSVAAATLGSSTASSVKNLHNLVFDITGGTKNITIPSGDTIVAEGTYTCSGGSPLLINTGVLRVTGNISVTNTYAGGGGTGTVLINGTGDQNLSGTSATVLGRFPKLVIDKSAGTLFLSNYINLGGNLTYTQGTINPGTSTLSAPGITYTCALPLELNNLEVHIGTTTLSSGTVIKVNGSLSKMAGTGITMNGGIIEVKKNLYNYNTSTAGGGNTLIKMNGTGTQKIESYAGLLQGALPQVEIDKAAGDTLKLIGIITNIGSWTHTGGILDAGTSTLAPGNTLSGNFSLYNLTFREASLGFTLSSGTITVKNTLRFIGSTYGNAINTGTIVANGDISVENTSTGGGGSATILISGTGDQIMTGAGIAARGFLPKVQINKPSGTLYLASIISAARDWEYIAGTVDASAYSSQVYFSGTYNIDAQGSSSAMKFYDVTVGGTNTLTGDLPVGHDLVINSTRTLVQGSYALSFGGYSNNGTHTGSGTVNFAGSGYSTFARAGGGATSFTHVTVNRSGGSLTLGSPLTITGDLTLTKGVIKTTATNILNFADNATSTEGNDSAYVHGPVRKTGDESFLFPLGDTAVGGSGKYHPLKITAPGSSTDAFTAAYYASGQSLGPAVDTLAIDSLSSCEHWTVSRDAGSSQVKVNVDWNKGQCQLAPDPNDMRLVQWNGSKWMSIGDVVTGTTVGSNNNLNTFGTFTLAQHVCSVVYKLNPIRPTATVVHKSDAATSDGSITLSVSGGNSPYTYSWSSGPATASLSALTTGIYSVTITDNIGCKAKKYYFIASKGATATYTLTPDGLAGKDASVLLGQDGVSGLHTNYAGHTGFDAAHADEGSGWYTQRSFLHFDLSSLPLNTVVNSATLHLYGAGSNLFAASNAAVLKRAGNPWDQHTLTWANQPYSYDTDAITLAASTSAGEDYSLDVLGHVKKMVANPYGNNGWMLRLAAEDALSSARLNFASSNHATSGLRPGIVIEITLPGDCDLNRNWVQTTTFGEEGEITSQSKSFMDNLGRSTQDQARILSNGIILATQTMYDGFGRPAGSTLPAPTYTNALCFKNNFMMDDSSHAYTYNDFDMPVTGSNLGGEVNNPLAVDNSTQGTVGWYYSNNNTEEAFVAATSFPYSRVQYTNDPTGAVRKAGGVDDMFRMGSGHETKTFTMASAGELDYIYGYRGTYNLAENSDRLDNYRSENLLVYKTLSINADGKEAISYTNSSGQLIASCVSGASEICTPQEVVQGIRYIERGYTTVHIPKSQNNSAELPLACVACLNNDPSLTSGNIGFNAIAGDSPGSIRILYKLQNAETGAFLIENTDYTLNRSTRKLTFINTYADTSLVLNIAYDVPQVYKQMLFLSAPPELGLKYKMDYSQWSLNYYDLKGRLVSSVAPNDINCSDYFQGSTSAVEEYKDHFTDIACITSTVVNGAAFTTHPASYAAPGLKQNVTITLFPSYEDPGFSSRYISPSDTLLFSRSLPVSSFGRFADTTVVIDTNTFKARSLEWLNNDLSRSYVEPLYTDSIIEYDSLGVATDTIVDSLAARLTNAQYLEFEVIADIGYKSTVGGNYYYQSEEQLMKYKLSYDFQLSTYVIVDDPDNTVNYFVPENIVDSIENIGIKFRAKSVRFEGYGNIDPTERYSLCSPSPTTPDATISQYLWNTVLYTYSNHLRVNYKAVINNYYTDVAPQLATTRIKYDTYNRVVQTISQDEGQSDVIYDEEGKVRFTQNDLQRTAGNGGRFSYVNYDKRGRVVESGEYDPNISNGSVTKLHFQTRAQFDAAINMPPSGAASLIWHTELELGDAIEGPRKKNKSGVIYDFPQGDVPSVAGGGPAYTQRNTHGRISKAWNENGATWYNYDERGGLTWTVQDIEDLGSKTYNYVTSLFGQLQQTQYQKESSTERLFHKYEYDADGRLVQSFASTDGGTTWNPLAKNEYYQHGPLKRTELGNALQGLDYVYTVGGALKSINDPYLTEADPGADSYSGAHSGVNPDVFGYSIDYYADDYKRAGTGIQTYNGSNFGGSNDSYAGIIKSVRWRTKLPTGATNNYGTSTLMYEYKYDFNYQLKDALFTPVLHNGVSGPDNADQPTAYHDPSHGNYSYAYATSDITYDLNGNIQTLKRNPYVALDAGVSPSDNLTYHYSSTLKNRLLYVSDAAGTGTGTETDFPNQSSNNYSYNTIGQLTADVKDGLTYEYYPDGLTKNIKQGGVLRAAFEYNHLGLRQKKTTYAGGEPSQYTWYVYDPGGALVSTYISTGDDPVQEELPLYAGGRVGMLNKTTGRYAFEISDHLGNVRSVIAKAAGSNAVEVLSYSDYYPHGGVLPGRNFVSSPSYRNGYQGKEKDVETGFTNFELRQYDPRLGRWFNPDPMGQYFSPYKAMGNNPISKIDPTGGYSVGGGAFGFDDGASMYNDYALNDPFFARDFEKQSHVDPMLMNEVRQQWSENYEYWRSNTNMRGEWETQHKETRTSTVVVHDPPTTYEMDPTHTETVTTDIMVSNPAVAIDGMNDAYFNNIGSKVKAYYKSGAYDVSRENGNPPGKKGWDFSFNVKGLVAGDQLQIVQILTHSNDVNYDKNNAKNDGYWLSPDGKTLGYVDGDNQGTIFYWGTQYDPALNRSQIDEYSTNRPGGISYIRAIDAPKFVNDPKIAFNKMEFHTYIVVVNNGSLKVIARFDSKYSGITRETKQLNLMEVNDFSQQDKAILQNDPAGKKLIQQ